MFYQFTFYFMFRHISYWKSLLKIIDFIKIIYKNVIGRKYFEFYFKSNQYLFQYFIKGNNLSIMYTSTAFFFKDFFRNLYEQFSQSVLCQKSRYTGQQYHSHVV